MTIYMVFPATRFIGLSTDTKPTTNVREGEIYHELDTHYDYIWDSTAWRGPCYWLGISYPFEETSFGY